MKLTCCIVDDEPLALNLLEDYVNKTPFLQLKGKYSGAVAALKGVKADPVDLIFLDIQMPDLNGLEVSRLLDDKTRVIFTTAFDRYAIDGYKVNAIDYLLKPISYSDFLQAAHKALQWYERMHPSREKEEIGSIFVKTDYKLMQIDLNKILYIEGLKDYVKIYIEDEPHPILSLMSLKSLEEMLPSRSFLRVHRSFIVQPGKIKMIERNRIVFGKQYIPISDSYKAAFLEFVSQRSLVTKL